LGVGGSAGGTILFNGVGGTLRVDGSVMPTATISSVVVGDTIDLAGVAFDSNGSTTALSGNVLQITENGSSYLLTFGSSTNLNAFHLTADGSGRPDLGATVRLARRRHGPCRDVRPGERRDREQRAGLGGDVGPNGCVVDGAEQRPAQRVVGR